MDEPIQTQTQPILGNEQPLTEEEAAQEMADLQRYMGIVKQEIDENAAAAEELEKECNEAADVLASSVNQTEAELTQVDTGVRQSIEEDAASAARDAISQA